MTLIKSLLLSLLITLATLADRAFIAFSVFCLVCVSLVRAGMTVVRLYKRAGMVSNLSRVRHVKRVGRKVAR